MLNKELILEVLRQIEESSQKVIDRFQIIAEPSDFTDSPTGMEKMDAICIPGKNNR